MSEENKPSNPSIMDGAETGSYVTLRDLFAAHALNYLASMQGGLSASPSMPVAALRVLRATIWRDLPLSETTARLRVLRESIEREAVAP